MRSHSVRRRAGPALLCAVLLVLASSACSDDDEPDRPEPSTTAPTTTEPTTTLSPEEEDEEALRLLAEEWFEAVRRIFVDGEDPALAEEYITGAYLEEFQQHVAEDEAAGHVTERDPQGRSRTTVESIEIDGDQAEITECLVDADVLKDGASGEVINDEVAARQLVTLAVRTPAGWRLSERTVMSRTEGAETCAE